MRRRKMTQMTQSKKGGENHGKTRTREVQFYIFLFISAKAKPFNKIFLICLYFHDDLLYIHFLIPNL